ncbi:MAG: peptidase M16 [Desulfuromonas sp.]|nr:MAG: peptidase M16 [Desulfuromonas sp.]
MYKDSIFFTFRFCISENNPQQDCRHLLLTTDTGMKFLGMLPSWVVFFGAKRGESMVDKTILTNGIRVLTEQIPQANSVSIGVWILNGSRHEKEQQAGISHFIEHMLFKGSSTCSSLDISKRVDALGGPLNGFTGREYSCLHLRTLPTNLKLAIPLLAELLLHSTYEPDEVEKERRVILQEIERLDHSPDEKIHDLFSQTFWPDSSLGRPVLGSAETVNRISRDELIAFAQERYINSSLIISVAGNIEHRQVLDMVDQAFSSVTALCLLTEQAEPLPVRAVRLDGAAVGQAQICLGTQALAQSHPNRFAGMLLNAVLGGGMSSRLFQSLREQRGLVYCAYSYLNSHSDSGSMVSYATTSTAHVSEVVALVLAQLDQLRREAVSAEELASVRERLQDRLEMSLDSTYSRMERMALSEIYQGEYIPVRMVMRELAKVSPDNLQKLANYLMSNDSLCLCVIGDVDDQAEKLQNISF